MKQEMTDQIEYFDNKAIPRLRVDELNENSTRYDQMAAAPPDETLVYYWYTWTAITLFVGLYSFLLFVSILIDREVRRRPFNLYLLYLLIPDFVFSFACGLTCLLNALNGSYYSKWMCYVQQWYSVFGIGGSAWVNAIIAYQIHVMLKDSHARRRYRVPDTRRVTLQCLVAFAWAIFLGSWGVYEDSNFPFHSGLVTGLACLPTEVDGTSSLFLWLVFIPLFVGIPTLYAIWVAFDIYRRKLLPPAGKRRLLSIYFGRLLLVFCTFWLPMVLLVFILPSFTSTWVTFAGGTWGHLQTLVSAVVISMKPDMQRAFKEFLICKRARAGFRGKARDDDLRASNVQSDKSFAFRSGSMTVAKCFRLSHSDEVVGDTPVASYGNMSLDIRARSGSMDAPKDCRLSYVESIGVAPADASDKNMSMGISALSIGMDSNDLTESDEVVGDTPWAK